MDPDEVRENMRRLVHLAGGELFGVCRVGKLRQTFHPEIRQISEKLNTAVSIGVPVLPAVLETIVDHPNVIYKAHYRQINHVLNDIAFMVSTEINRLGRQALPIPASQMISWKPMRAHLSHREIAWKAGLGWWGRNNLLVNETYGAQVRLVTVLTDLELPDDQPATGDCGDCYACLENCPAGAIAEDRRDFNLAACFEKVSEFARPERIGSYICGLCLAPCRGKRNSPGAYSE